MKVDDIIMIKIRESFENALGGGFMNDGYNSQKSQSINLRIFVSSTFTDTHDERNILLNQILPKLKEYIKQIDSDINLIFVDMRYGVKNESGNHHMTWMVCRAELERCRDESAGIFFLSLQSNKYGYRSLPKYINKNNFDECIINYSDLSDKDELIKIAKDWYILDENSIDLIYSLKSLTKDNSNEYWSKVLPSLLKLLNGCKFGGDGLEKDLYNIGESVTNYETTGALKDTDSCKRSIWWYRQFSSPITIDQDPKNNFDDVSNIRSPPSYINLFKKINDMKDMMKNKIPPENIHSHTLESSVLQTVTNNVIKNGIEKEETSTILINNSKKKDYLISFEDKIYNIIKDDIDKIHQKYINFSKNAFYTGMLSIDATDMAHHLELARNKVNVFQGRNYLIQKVLIFCNEENKTTNGKYDCISFYITGKSGSGKTSLMAKFASELYNIELKSNKPRPVIIRFCGTNVASTTGVHLVGSICKQIHFLIHGSSDINIPLHYASVVKYLHKLLKENPVILLIDSIDQLNDDNKERSEISFLKDLKPHKDTRIIISCLPDEKDLTTNEFLYWYGCQTLLNMNNVRSLKVELLGQSDQNVNEIGDILDFILLYQGRKLTNEQREYCLKQAKNEPTLLYMTFVVRIVSQWKSTDTPIIDTNCFIENSVSLIIQQIFDSLKLEYGPKLVKTAIAFITLSLNGVSDSEMEDLLSLDEEVMNEVNEWNQSSRLNSHVWLRLRGALKSLIIVSNNDCIKWYHRQLSETAMDIFTLDEKEYYHQIMGKYFGNIIDTQIVVITQIQLQPLLFNFENSFVWIADKRSINARRCSEASYNLIKGKLFKEAINELCNIEVICACFKTYNGYTLLNCFIEIIGLFNKNKDILKDLAINYKRVLHYFKWIKSETSSIIKCFDPVLAITESVSSQPTTSIARIDIEKLINISQNKQSFNEISFNNKDNVWYRCITLGGYDNFSSIEMKIAIDHLFCIAYSHKGNKIISGSYYGLKIWDANNGKLINTLHLNRVDFVSFNHDESQIISVTRFGCITIWDVTSGRCITTLELNQIDQIKSLAISNDGSKIVFGGGNGSWCSLYSSDDGSPVYEDGSPYTSDNTVKIWNTISGVCMSTLTGHIYDVTAVIFSYDESKVISGSIDGIIKIWDTNNDTCLISIFVNNSIDSLAINCSGTLVISGSFKLINIWNANNGELINTFKGHFDLVQSISFNDDESQIISGCRDRCIKIWDVTSGECKTTLNDRYDDTSINTVFFNHDGSKIISGNETSMKIWDCTHINDIITLTGHSSYVATVKFNHDGSKVVSCSADNTIKLWDVNNGKCLTTLFGHTDQVYTVSFNSDSSKIVSGGKDNTIKIWDAINGLCLFTLRGHYYEVKFVSFNHDDTYILSSSGDRIIIWDVNNIDNKSKTENNNTENVINIDKSDNNINTNNSNNENESTFFSTTLISDENCLFIIKMIDLPGEDNDEDDDDDDDETCLQKFHYKHYNDEKVIKIFNSNSKNTIIAPTNLFDDITSVIFNHDGSKLIFGADAVEMWDYNSGKCLAKLIGHTRRINCIVVNNDSSKIISGSEDSTIKIWDVINELCLFTLNGHSFDVRSINISNDGSKVVSCSTDKTIKLWDVNNGKCLATLFGHSEPVYTVSFNSDSSKIVSGSQNCAIKIWDAKIITS